MTADFCEEVEEILAAALEVGPKWRLDLLEALCAGRPELRAEVESLLAALTDASSFLEPPVPLPSNAQHTSLGPFHDGTPGAGATVGPYRLVEVIGEGGMGKVFRAERADGQFNHQVAIKFVRVPTPSDVRRIRAERQILATLQHPHVVALLDGGSLPSGHAYLVMEYVRGTTITAYCSERRLSLKERLRLFYKVTLAVHHAHERQVVHRDLKPSNVLVLSDGTPKVLDFGIAKLLDGSALAKSGATMPGFNPVTPNYASPEQLRGLPVTPTADIYSLGVLLHEILTGVRPYETAGKPLDEVLDLVLETHRPAPSTAVVPPEASPPYPLSLLEGDLDAVVLRAMAQAPEDRYPSVTALGSDLIACLEGRPVASRWQPSSGGTGRPVWRLRRSAAWTVRAAAMLACLAMLLSVGDVSTDRGAAPKARTGRAPLAPAAGRGGTANAGAQAAYERGLQAWRTRTDLPAAIRSFREAISLDQGFALAHVALADAYAVQVSPSSEAERQVAEALRLVPELGEAYASEGFIQLFHYWDWIGAEESLRRAIALAPDYAPAHQWLGSYLTIVRRFAEARESLERAARLDPQSPAILLDLGLLALFTGDDERAARNCELARVLSAGSLQVSRDCLARAYEHQGRHRQAWAADEWNLGSSRPVRGDGPQLLRAAMHMWVDKTVRYLGDETVSQDFVDPNIAYRLATAHARLGNEDGALAWLGTGVRRHAFLMPYMNVDPVFDGYRDDGRFKDLLSRIGLSP